MSNINPKVDIAFKKIFGVEENKDLLISLINSIVSKSVRVYRLKTCKSYQMSDAITSKSACYSEVISFRLTSE